MIAALLIALQAAPAPGELASFGDWIAGCDNGLACEAQSLPIENDGSVAFTPVQIIVARGPGARDAPVVRLLNQEEDPSGRLMLIIDGREIGEARRGEDDLYDFTASARPALIEAIINGRSASARTGDGPRVDPVSLDGSAAALRWIDDRQRRAGTATALVAAGPAPAASLPPPPALPAVRQVRAARGASFAPLDGEAARALSEAEDCYLRDGMPLQNESHAIGPGTAVTLISCDAGAYNFNALVYVRRGGGGAPEPARFDHPAGWSDEGPPLLVNAWWDPVAATLNSHARGRGIGDCGTAQSYVWDGAMFRLVEQRVMDECRGSLRWITVWRAGAVPE